jgi:dipeptidyl aminopeptidase/acylaminoacyl peptidase
MCAHGCSLMRIAPAVAVSLSAALSGPAAGQQPPRTALAVSEALGIAQFTPQTQIDISADGQWIAFTVQDPPRAAASAQARYFDDRGVPGFQRGTDVYLADPATGMTRRLTDGHGSSWGPVWSPDGRTLAFYSDRDGLARVWLWDREQDRVVRLSDEVVRPYWGFEQIQWSADGRRLLVKLVPLGMSFSDLDRLLPLQAAAPGIRSAGRTATTARVFAHTGATAPNQAQPAAAAAPIDIDSVRSFLNVQLGDLAVLDVPSGRVQRIATRARLMGYRFAPSGDRVAFSTRQPDAGTGSLVYDRYDIQVVDVPAGKPQLIAAATTQEWGLGFSWSPDGSLIAYLDGDAVHTVTTDDGAKGRVFSRENVPLRHDYRPPLWIDAQSLVLAARDTLWRLSLNDGSVTPAGAPAGRTLLEIVAPASAQQLHGREVTIAVSDPESKKVGFHRIDMSTGTATPLVEADLALGESPAHQLSAARDGRFVAFVAETGASPPNLWISYAPFTKIQPLTDLHPEISRLALGKSQLVQWIDSQDRTLQGALLLPADYQPGVRYPLVVKVYAGARRSAAVNRFGFEAGVDNLQLLATRGYAVLIPDAPARVGTPVADIVGAVRGGVDAVVAMGVADAERTAVLGHSYGGYSALALATAWPRLRAVISSGGFSNLFSEYAGMRDDGSAVGVGWAERGQGRMGGNPWDYFDRYRDNSPFFFLDRVTAPVLLLHGGSDPIVSAEASMQTFVALRRLGKDVKLVIYDGERHHPAEWSIANTTDYWEQIFHWLQAHLAGR